MTALPFLDEEIPPLMVDQLLPNAIQPEMQRHPLFSPTAASRQHVTTTRKPIETTKTPIPEEEFSLDKVLQLLFTSVDKETPVKKEANKTRTTISKHVTSSTTTTVNPTSRPSSGHISKPTKKVTTDGNGGYSNHPNSVDSIQGVGLLKLAGCNIYGRMYRVGRIISELSGPCLECKCTEVGVQCKPLGC